MPWQLAAFLAFPLLTGYVVSHYGAGAFYLHMLGFDEKTVRSLNRWTFPLTYFTFVPIFLAAGLDFTGMVFRGKVLVETVLFFMPLLIAASTFVLLVLKKRRG